jgi:hypothetical protein
MSTGLTIIRFITGNRASRSYETVLHHRKLVIPLDYDD